MFASKQIILGLLASLPLLGAPALAAEAPAARGAGVGELKHAEDEVIVRFKDRTSALGKASAHARASGATKKRFRALRDLEVVKLPRGLSVKEAVKRYKEHPDVLYAEPNYAVKSLATPNDPSFSQLWGLQNTGQAGGTADADIDAPGAWDITTGSSAVVVAAIDTGIDYNHPGLAANMFRNEADCNANGVDDDGNGFVDDCYGIDTSNNDSNPMDDNKHGTHVAGTIGAVGDDGVGVVGVNWDVSIMACKFLSASGSGYTSDAVDCLDYLAMMKDRGVDIVATNNSWGGGGFSQALYDAIDAHRQRGILFIAAAGNDFSNNDATPSYPANYNLPNVISVAATNRWDGLAYFSNYGRRTVHVGAPGQEILSTTPGNTYSTLSGTSMATPHVTGLAALLKAQDPARDWRAIKNLILAGGDSVGSMAATTVTQRRINAQGALNCSGATVFSRLKPAGDAVGASVGSPVDLAALNIQCAGPNGEVEVAVSPGGQVVTLRDDGLGGDQSAGDGVYSGQFTPPALGSFRLTFPGGDVVTVEAQPSYVAQAAPYSYRTIGGANLNLGDESYAAIALPFPVPFGGGSFDTLFIGSNGNASFSAPSTDYSNGTLPTSQADTLVAPFWDDLYAVTGSSQNVFWAVLGTAPNRELVVEWRNVRNYWCSTDSLATVKFQVVFFEDRSDVLFNYADTLFGGACSFADRGGSATVGIQRSSTAGTQFSVDSAAVQSGSALLWSLVGAEPPAPAIDVTPASLDFGNVAVGSSADRTFTVRNVGGATLDGSAAASAPFSIVGGDSYSLGPNQSRTVTVRFSPDLLGSFAGNVVFTGGGDASKTVGGAGVAQFALTVAKAGGGSGAVTSAPAGINCGADCAENYTAGATVNLTATPAADSIFDGWSGACSGAGPCAVAMDADHSVTANFSKRLNLIAPNGGEIWTIGTARTIQWSTRGVAGKVKILLSRDGGATWRSLTNGTNNDGNHIWKANKPATTRARIRICSVSSPSICDASDADFTIR